MQTREAYTSKFPDIPFQMQFPGRAVAPFGFGGYRVSARNNSHKQALHKALLSGLNLIDTSTNYADGQSEELVGEVLGGMLFKQEVHRQDIHVVTKVGYIQGANLERVRALDNTEKKYAKVVNYADHLRHSIDPQFIHDQLTESLDRLKLSYVDTLLLHNPEYFLMHAAANDIDKQAARTEFYTRIQDAFTQLEREVGAGRIRNYGISSNTFVGNADAADFCSLERILQIAAALNPQHSFKVVQMPFNLLEHAAATQLNQNDKSESVLDLAARRGLAVLINRPLNAITKNQLIRLAAPRGYQEVQEPEVRKQLNKMLKLEERFRTEILPAIQLNDEEKNTLNEWLSPGSALNRSLDAFEGREHWQSAKQRHFEPRIKHGIDFLARLKDPAVDVWAGSFIAQSSKLFAMIDNLHAHSSAQQAQTLLEKFGPLFKDKTDSLSHLALNAVRRHSAVSCVLVGMRTEDYVNDCLAALAAKDAPETSDAEWQAAATVA